MRIHAKITPTLEFAGVLKGRASDCGSSLKSLQSSMSSLARALARQRERPVKDFMEPVDVTFDYNPSSEFSMEVQAVYALGFKKRAAIGNARLWIKHFEFSEIA